MSILSSYYDKDGAYLIQIFVGRVHYRDLLQQQRKEHEEEDEEEA